MTLFSDWEEYEKMGKSAPGGKVHLDNLERERREREVEAAARRRCIYPRCPGAVEVGELNPAKPWVNSGLCASHYREFVGEGLPPAIEKRHAAKVERRAIYNEVIERGNNG